jgi:hypothetical protein
VNNLHCFDRFLDRWGQAAAALGWPAEDLFERAAFGADGLVWERKGRVVLALTADQAVVSGDARSEYGFFGRAIGSEGND